MPVPDTIPLNLIPVPEGWTYTLIEGLPLIERDVGNFTISVGLDDGDWRWWLCPKGTGVADANGSADSQLAAIFAVLNALMGKLLDNNNNPNTDGDNVATTTPGIATSLLTLFRQALPAEDDWQVKPGLNVIRPTGNEWSFDVLAIDMPLIEVLDDGSILARPWEEAASACDFDGGKTPLLLVRDTASDAWWAFYIGDVCRATVSIQVGGWRSIRKEPELYGWKLTPAVIQQLVWV